MIYKLKTSRQTMDIFAEIEASQGLQPFALSKIAIALSLHRGVLETGAMNSDSDGLELNRQQIFGEYEGLFQALITMNSGETPAEETFFPRLTKAHLDRGAKLLLNEARYGMKFYENLLSFDRNI